MRMVKGLSCMYVCALLVSLAVAQGYDHPDAKAQKYGCCKKCRQAGGLCCFACTLEQEALLKKRLNIQKLPATVEEELENKMNEENDDRSDDFSLEHYSANAIMQTSSQNGLLRNGMNNRKITDSEKEVFEDSIVDKQRVPCTGCVDGLSMEEQPEMMEY